MAENTKSKTVLDGCGVLYSYSSDLYPYVDDFGLDVDTGANSFEWALQKSLDKPSVVLEALINEFVVPIH